MNGVWGGILCAVGMFFGGMAALELARACYPMLRGDEGLESGQTDNTRVDYNSVIHANNSCGDCNG